MGHVVVNVVVSGRQQPTATKPTNQPTLQASQQQKATNRPTNNNPHQTNCSLASAHQSNRPTNIQYQPITIRYTAIQQIGIQPTCQPCKHASNHRQPTNHNNPNPTNGSGRASGSNLQTNFNKLSNKLLPTNIRLTQIRQTLQASKQTKAANQHRTNPAN